MHRTETLLGWRQLGGAVLASLVFASCCPPNCPRPTPGPTSKPLLPSLTPIAGCPLYAQVRADNPALPPSWGYQMLLNLATGSPTDFGQPVGITVDAAPPSLPYSVPLTAQSWGVNAVVVNLPTSAPFSGPYLLTLHYTPQCQGPFLPVPAFTVLDASNRDMTFQVSESDDFVLTPFILLGTPKGTSLPPTKVTITGNGQIWAGVLLTSNNGPNGWLNYSTNDDPKFPVHAPGGANRPNSPHPYGLIFGYVTLPQYLQVSIPSTYAGQLLQGTAINRAEMTIIDWHWSDNDGRPGSGGCSRGGDSTTASICVNKSTSTQVLLLLGINDDIHGNGSGAFTATIHVDGPAALATIST